MSNFTTVTMPGQVVSSTDHVITFETFYNAEQRAGVSILTAASAISLFSVVGLLVVLGFSAYKTYRIPNIPRYMRTHVMAYFISLLLCDAISAVGSLMNGAWVGEGGIRLNALCTAQGALKNTGNVGTALWSMVIAIHTFTLLVLKWRSNDYTLYATLFVVWSFIGLVVIIGPSAVQNLASKGPYFGISGYWCWITDGYSVQRVALEYIWMFISAFVSLVMYSAVFFSLRGNLVVSGGQFRFRRKGSTWQPKTGKNGVDGQTTVLAKHMLMYPLLYTGLILPIAICRFMTWAGHAVSFEFTIFADTVFLLSGFVNVVLFTATRRIIPLTDGRSFFARSKTSTSDSDLESQSFSSRFETLPVVHPFIVSEKKLTVSVIAKRDSQMMVEIPITPRPQLATVPVTVPVPALRTAAEALRYIIPKRGVSLAPTVISAYSQSSSDSPPPVPTPPSVELFSFPAVPTVTVVKKASTSAGTRRGSMDDSSSSDVEEDLGHRYSWSEESHSRYSASSETPMVGPVRPLPVPPTAHTK